ncbi:MAG TPA: PqqD family protein [Pyrinomonadaceae bacterium]|nr:PqqD family protein [Pyrinomonadaceae bacterium]
MSTAGEAARPHDHVVFTDFEGGEGVLVDLNTKRYYTLNETAALIWRALERGEGAEEIVRQLTEAYDVTAEHAAASLDKTLSTLRARQLLR